MLKSSYKIDSNQTSPFGPTPDKNFDLKIRRDHEKISYERRVYESVNDKRVS